MKLNNSTLGRKSRLEMKFTRSEKLVSSYLNVTASYFVTTHRQAKQISELGTTISSLCQQAFKFSES